MTPITDVREISNIAYGFIASKVLFGALNATLFDLLAGGARPLAALAEDTGIGENRLETLLTACVSLGLMERHNGGFVNAPASQQYLVSSSPRYFGDTCGFRSTASCTPCCQTSTMRCWDRPRRRSTTSWLTRRRPTTSRGLST